MTERLQISGIERVVLPTRTRFPFRYGIASMTDVPQLFLRTVVRVGQRSAPGLAGEGLPPKWFTKDPSTTFEQDLPDLYAVIEHAAARAEEIARTPVTFFDLWRELNRLQTEWAQSRGTAPLLAHLGVSLVERMVLDGVCRALGQPFHALVASNALGVRLGEIYPELAGSQPADWLPRSPRPSCYVRHTVGLADPLTDADIAPEERVRDGLPQDLESSIRAYGLLYFKVKLTGSADRDLPRLERWLGVVHGSASGEFFLTLDGNENFHSFEAFREFWQTIRAAPALAGLWKRVLAVEQPVHRDRALGEEARVVLQRWPDRPPLIIDESDGAVGDVPRALELGYDGASHKNCKGIVKGLANAALLERRRRDGRAALLTGEDLANLGPVALLQDLALMALLGIEHVERNGHHYYRGLSMLPPAWQDAALGDHGDLYARHPQGFAALRIAGGQIALASVNAAPFGVAPCLDPAALVQAQADRTVS